MCAYYYYSSGRNAKDQKFFLEKMHLSADYVIGKYPNCGIFMLGGAY